MSRFSPRPRRDCGVVLASVFVNPTQFDDPGDFDRYPRTWERDFEMMEAAGVDFVFCPSGQGRCIPTAPATRSSTRSDYSRELCGAHRPGHFSGVLTVVMKLLQIAEADRAYFGEKDFQQLELVRGMCAAFFLPTEIIGCPTVREADGLAMSSRNARLSEAERAARAPCSLRPSSPRPDSAAAARTALEAASFEVDYVEDRPGRRFGAVPPRPDSIDRQCRALTSFFA